MHFWIILYLIIITFVSIARTNCHYSDLVDLCIHKSLQVWEWLRNNISMIHSRGGVYLGLFHSHNVYKWQQQVENFILDKVG
jgi:hypothetical protein